MASFAELKRKLMANPDFRAKYEKADAEFKRIEEKARANSEKAKAAD